MLVYWLIGNILKYGRFTPPDYDVSKVTAPVVLHYADNDWLAAVKVIVTCQRVHCCPVAKYFSCKPTTITSSSYCWLQT
jgi:hypothetical protein